MAISCPQKGHPDWVALVNEVGEDKAYEEFLNNDFTIPTVWRSTNEQALNETINTFLASTGVTVQNVKEIVNRNGEVIGANAMADLVYKTIQVVNGKERVDTLPEEASHFLVAMLRGSVLYDSMFNDVQSYSIYKDVVREYNEQYDGNETKLKEEAMAKIISSIVVNNFTDPKLQRRANGWWNAVIEYLRKLFAYGGESDLHFGILENAPFSEAADMIINNVVTDSYTPSREDDAFYQLAEQDQKSVMEAVENNLGRGSLILEGENYELVARDGTKKTIKNRVSDRVKAAFGRFGVKEFTAQEEASNSIRRDKGTIGHADLQNIFERTVAIKDGKIVPAKTEGLGSEIYKTLESYVRNFIVSFPADVRFVVEQKVYDEKADEAGTIDLLAIYPDGRTDIYDWKFQEFKGSKDTKSIAKSKKKAWNIQLARYSEILQKTYGIRNIGRKRVIPIETVYENNQLKSIKVGATEIDKFTKKNEHLKPVPIYSEMTGDERLDGLLEDLLRQKEELEKRKPSNIEDDAKRSAFIEQRKIRLDEIERAIQDIQLTNDIKAYVTRGIKQINDINDTGIRNLSEEELNEAYKNMTFYGQELIKRLGDLVRDKTKTYQADLMSLTANAQAFQGELLNEFIRRSREEHGDDINAPQKGASFWTRSMRTLSQQNHPVLKAFYRLVQGSKQKTREQLKELNNKIETSLEQLRRFQSNKGINESNMFDFMLDKSGRTMRLAAKYSPEFYNQRNNNRDKLKNGTKAEQEASLQWFRKNTIFDEERYEKAYDEHKKQSEKFYKNYDNTNEVVKRTLKDFENRYGDNSTGYRNGDNYFVRPSEEFYSEGYKEIQANKELKDFYDLFTENTALYRKIVGQPHDARFVWNIKRDFVESIAENGLSSTNSLSFLEDAFSIQAGVRDGNVDPQTGEAQHTLPVYFIEGVETARQSTDLGRVLYMAGAMAYNYKYMAEIEDSSKSLEIILRSSEEILTNNNGEEIVNKMTGRLQKVIGSSDTIEQYKDYMNYYVYGIKNKTKDFKFNVAGKEISGLATYNFVNKMFVGKSLAFNPVSIVANSVGGDWNVRILGAGKRFFTNSQYNSSLKDMGVRDAKAYSVIGYLDLIDGENNFMKANDLSVHSLTKHVTYENMFIGQKLGDFTIRNSVGLSMLKSHTLQDGKIVRIRDGKKGEPSIYDMLSVQEDKLTGLDSIPEKELEKLRTKILKVTEDILGNNSRDDIRTVGLTVMGRALMSFRSWIPRTIDSRYGELRFSEDIQEYELGRYRSFWNQIVTKQFLPLVGETLVNFGSFGYADFGNATRNRAKELYREAIINDPKLTLSEEEFIDIHIANLRANMMEMYIVGSMLALIFMVKPNPDDDKSEFAGLRKYIHRQMNRNMSELLFYYNPAEFNKMLKSPIPITRAFTDLFSLFSESGKEAFGTITNDDQMKYDARPMKYGLRIFPIFNGLESVATLIDEDYDRASEETFTSKSR